MSDDERGDLPYRRVLLKLSGEALAGEEGFGIAPQVIDRVAQEVSEARRLGVELAVVIGGGNIFRGLQASARGMERASADAMGMLATVINALAVGDALERAGCPARVMSSIPMGQVAEPYVRSRATRHLEKGRVVIFGGGTGSPYFSTDTAAALRALEIHADVLLKGTKVDGVYDADPVTRRDARRFREISYLEVLQRGLRVMDSTAISMCMDNGLPIRVFSFSTPGNLGRILAGDEVGTIVR